MALTGLAHKEFKVLLPVFVTAYARRALPTERASGQPRQRAVSVGRPSVRATSEQQLLFILVYLKTYPLPVVMGRLFGVSQGGVNPWIHRLLPILQVALARLGVKPTRDGRQLAL